MEPKESGWKDPVDATGAVTPVRLDAGLGNRNERVHSELLI